MVTRANGAPKQGMWFGADVRILTITTDLSTWLADLVASPDTLAQRVAAVGSGLEQALEAVAARATIIGVTVIDNDTLHVMVDYANAFTAGNTEGTSSSIEAELAVAINAIATPNFANTTVDTFAGFAGATPGTAT
jgi:hypothetical protein